MGPSPDAPQPCCPSRPPLPHNLDLGFVLPVTPQPPTESGLGPGADDLMCVTLFGNPRAASPSTVPQVEPAGLDAAPGHVPSWGVSSSHFYGIAGHISKILRCIRPFIPCGIPVECVGGNSGPCECD